MPDYRPEDVDIGMICRAPFKRPGSNKRSLEEAKVTWVSTDGLVVSAQTLPRPHQPRVVSGDFAVSKLLRPESAA